MEGFVSYFDHVRCHACKAMIDPESVGGSGGKGMTCPRCGAALSLTDLFGLAAAFSEEEEENVSLDDLVPGAPPPPKPSATKPAAKPAPAKPAAKPAPAKPAPAKPSPVRPVAAKPSDGALVHKPSAEQDDAAPEGGALAALRSLKKRR